MQSGLLLDSQSADWHVCEWQAGSLEKVGDVMTSKKVFYAKADTTIDEGIWAVPTTQHQSSGSITVPPNNIRHIIILGQEPGIF